MLGDIEDRGTQSRFALKRDSRRERLFREEEARLADQERKELAGSFPAGGSLEEKLQYFLLRYGRTEDSYPWGGPVEWLFTGASSFRGFGCLIWSERIVSGIPCKEHAALRPKFESKKEGQLWLECVRDYYQQIEAGMSDGSYQPHVSIWPDAEDSMDPEAPYFTPWLAGIRDRRSLV